MKIPIILGMLLLLISCKDHKEVTIKPDLSELPESKIIENNNPMSIPSYNFDEFSQLLKKNNDTTYIINFWATWCKPCIKELPAFERIHNEYSSNNVKVILASLDFPKQLDSHLIPFIDKHQIKSEVVLLIDPDSNSWIPKVDTNWTGAIPATIIYNSKQRRFYERTFNYDELTQEINSINKK
jgi:thiol-disulfide isomerase/thioredoxin